MTVGLDLTFAICTRNRASYLRQCLASIYGQGPSSLGFLVLVVNNGSVDDTKTLVEEYATLENFNAIQEDQIGLSHARNTALANTTTRWLAFVDDDAILPSNYLEILTGILAKTSHACLGGPVKPIYAPGAPNWTKRYFTRKSDFGNVEKQLLDECIAGANMVLDCHVMQKIGSFNTNLGMIGEKIRYGEDDYIQHELRRQGYTIGYYPHLEIGHHVLPSREKVSWHLKAAYQHGWASQALASQTTISSIGISMLRTTISGLVKHLPENIWRNFTNEQYYWQNTIVNTCRPFLYNLGRFVCYLSHKTP
ncbi:MAG: glycosyltransferase [Saprospiraceae bacterium]|nr:glycosyltransferase [Saprospiraceae bacterium]